MTASKHRILITGARSWKDYELLRGTIIGIIQSRGWADEKVVIVHGDCPNGADAMAKAFVTNLHSSLVTKEDNPADWSKNPRSAGHIRNGVMVRKGAEVCIAFTMPCEKNNCPKGKHPHITHGTADCVKKARAAHIEVIQVRGWDF